MAYAGAAAGAAAAYAGTALTKYLNSRIDHAIETVVKKPRLAHSTKLTGMLKTRAKEIVRDRIARLKHNPKRTTRRKGVGKKKVHIEDTHGHDPLQFHNHKGDGYKHRAYNWEFEKHSLMMMGMNEDSADIWKHTLHYRPLHGINTFVKFSPVILFRKHKKIRV
jgi:hypothetical protein